MGRCDSGRVRKLSGTEMLAHRSSTPRPCSPEGPTRYPPEALAAPPASVTAARQALSRRSAYTRFHCVSSRSPEARGSHTTAFPGHLFTAINALLARSWLSGAFSFSALTNHGPIGVTAELGASDEADCAKAIMGMAPKRPRTKTSRSRFMVSSFQKDQRALGTTARVDGADAPAETVNNR